MKNFESIRKWKEKQTRPGKEKFRIISIDGYECVKVWTSMPTALLTSTHPPEKYSNSNYIYESQNFSTYNCMENLDLENFDGEFYLYGQPFYDDKCGYLDHLKLMGNLYLSIA